MAGERAQIVGSEVKRNQSARSAGPADPNEILTATIVIRRRPGAAPAGGTREEIEKSLSADNADMAAVCDFARHHGLTVTAASPEKRSVQVEGRIRDFDEAFGIDLRRFEDKGHTFLSYDGPLSVDSDVAGSVTAVLGLNREPVAQPRPH